MVPDLNPLDIEGSGELRGGNEITGSGENHLHRAVAIYQPACLFVCFQHYNSRTRVNWFNIRSGLSLTFSLCP